MVELLPLLLRVSSNHPISSGDKLEAVIALFFFMPIPIILAVIGFFKWKKYRKVADIPTSTVRGMAAGLVELNGKVKSIELLTSPLTKTKCVYYKKQHQVYSHGKHPGWKNASWEIEQVNFYLDDGTSKVEVNPELADISLQINETRTKGDQRDLEYILAPGSIVYAIGTAVIRPNVKSAEKSDDFIVTKGQNDSFYYISDKKEAQVKASLKSDAKTYLFTAGILFATIIGYAIYVTVA